tara:strand:+ start:8556 stop:9587 length:1032 start_codon:yes stop_codon:yes gene_type:complete
MGKFARLAVAMLLLAGSVVGCSDYAITARYAETETVYVEVPGETEYVEIPGETDYGEIWVDHFVQPASVDGVDILWVIDTSGSMYQYEPDLLLGIEAMMNALPESGWRLAMMSNDPVAALGESQFPLVPGDDIADAIDMYNAMGTGHREEGFDAVYEYIQNNSYASTWLRPDAALLVVFVSDEEEQSDDYMIDVVDFTNWFGALRGGSAFVASVVNVEQADSVCASPPSIINIGDRYIEATNYFGGVIVDICDEDWAPGVTDASNSVEPHEYWDLTHIPSHEDTIRVFHNGVLNWDWVFDPATNSVEFTVIPGANVLVEIAYHYEPVEDGDDDDSADTGDTGA